MMRQNSLEFCLILKTKNSIFQHKIVEFFHIHLREQYIMFHLPGLPHNEVWGLFPIFGVWAWRGLWRKILQAKKEQIQPISVAHKCFPLSFHKNLPYFAFINLSYSLAELF